MSDTGDDTTYSDSLFGYGVLPQVELALLTRQGGRRYNEDACGHWHSPHGLCCVVADGAGGHGGGQVAARLAVRSIIESYARAAVAEVEELRALLQWVNEEVIRHRGDADEQRHMHTTVVTLMVDLDRSCAIWGHVGDSRLYVFRQGEMLAHTRDHSAVQAMVEAGMLRAEELRTNPRRSELYSALGTDPQYLKISVVKRPWNLRIGDAFLLCTDGLWEWVDEVDISAALARAATPEQWLARLEQLVLRNAAAAGKVEHDNFSGLALWVGNSGG